MSMFCRYVSSVHDVYFEVILFKAKGCFYVSYTYSLCNNWTPTPRKDCKASSRNGYFQLTTDVYSGSQMGMNS